MEEQLRSDGVLESLRSQIRVHVMNALTKKGLRPPGAAAARLAEDSDEFVGLLVAKEFLDSVGLPHSASMLAAESGRNLSATRFELLEQAGLSEDDGRPALLQILDRCASVGRAPAKSERPSDTPADSEPTFPVAPAVEEDTVRRVSCSSKYSERQDEQTEVPPTPSTATVQKHSGLIRSSKGWETTEDDSNDFAEEEESPSMDRPTGPKADISLEELADMDDDLDDEDTFQMTSAGAAGNVMPGSYESRQQETQYAPEDERKNSWEEGSDSFESTNEEIDPDYNPSKSIVENNETSLLFQRNKNAPAPAEDEEDYGEDFEESAPDSVEEDISEDEGSLDEGHYKVEDLGGERGLSRSTGGFLKTLPRLDDEDEAQEGSGSRDADQPKKTIDHLENSAGSDLEAISVGGASDDGGFFDD